MGEFDVGWQDCVGGFVVEIVADVGEEGSFWGNFFDEFDGFGQVGVGGVGFAAEGVEDKDIKLLEEREGLFGDIGHVGEVGGGTEAVAGDGVAAVRDRDALEGGAEEWNFGGKICGKAVDVDASAGGVAVDGAKCVFEDALDDGGGGVVGVEGDAFGPREAEGTEVVHAEDVIGVRVGVEDCVDCGEIFADGLGVEVWGRCR